ncbi:hypothetical protein HNR12_004551 [Streptomonospora nanhaiensis]|uniref:Transcriptional regulator n=1 Tax=Streptomonospora nanhaiensis TaxID=1323731 RepID=A0A853BTK6_9ACTN|nr:hypothetical protein [Streptomonospora nanhaiensis]NYI98274.1 hypothetical protein [Streptomonospora nanhaiensis]
MRRLTAAVLSEATGTPHTAAALWGAIPGPRVEATATDGLLGRRSLTDVLATATAWTSGDVYDQVAVHPAPEDRLFAAVWDATRQAPHTPAPAAAGADHVHPPLMDLLERHLAELRRLDDTAGGGALSQRYVRTALANVLDLLRHSRYTPAIGIRLLRNAAGLAQLAGWMAFDASLPAAAQRYQLLAIRLARAAEDHDAVANVLGMLAYQHAAIHHPAAALRFAEAALDHTHRSLPVVRARALGRLATAHAAAGDIDAFRSASEQCRALLQRHRAHDGPPYLYYFTAEQVAAEAGQALVDLAAANAASPRRLLTEAVHQLAPLAAYGPATGYRRSALLHGIHLARATLQARDAEATVQALLRLTDHLGDVQSIRCRHLLAQLRRRAGSQLRSPEGADALRRLDQALSEP